MKCRKCQFENPAGMKFCGECGTELTLVCPSCSAANPPQFKFCGESSHWPCSILLNDVLQNAVYNVKIQCKMIV